MGMIRERIILRGRREEKHTIVMPQLHRCHTCRDDLLRELHEADHNSALWHVSIEFSILKASAACSAFALHDGDLNAPSLDFIGRDDLEFTVLSSMKVG